MLIQNVFRLLWNLTFQIRFFFVCMNLIYFQILLKSYLKHTHVHHVQLKTIHQYRDKSSETNRKVIHIYVMKNPKFINNYTGCSKVNWYNGNILITRSNWTTFTSINIIRNTYKENPYFQRFFYNNYLCLQPLCYHWGCKRILLQYNSYLTSLLTFRSCWNHLLSQKFYDLRTNLICTYLLCA